MKLSQEIADLGPKQVLLITHEGPADQSTTWNRNEALAQGGEYKLGSKFLLRYLNENEQIVCNIHGHVHSGSFLDHVKDKCKIINPRSLRENHFATLDLRRRSGKWEVASVSQHFV